MSDTTELTCRDDRRRALVRARCWHGIDYVETDTDDQGRPILRVFFLTKFPPDLAQPFELANVRITGGRPPGLRALALDFERPNDEAVDDVAITTDVIAGFPGETRGDVEELKGFLQRMRFDRVGIFTYSHEEGTSAYGLNDDVPAEEKEERAQEIMEVQQEISLEKNMEKIGQTFKVLIDKKEAGRYLGRTEFDSVEVDNEVIVQSKKKLPIGEFVQVKITKAYDYDIEGEVAE